MIGRMATRISSPVLIGRTAELARVREAIEATLEGRPTPLLVSGEAGVGKTRLVEELAKLAAERGMLVLRGTCANVGDGGLPYGPIVEALRGLVAELDPDLVRRVVGQSGAELGMLVSSLGTGGPGDGSTQRQWLQARVFDALLGLLQRLAVTTPTVLFLEDLHWSDQATRETATFLARALRDARVLLVMTYRSDELHRRHPLLPWLAELERAGSVERIALRRLELGEVRELVREIAGTSPDDERAALIFRRSDGNPFFVEELLAADRESGGSPQLPSTLREILIARIGAIPEAAQGLLGVAAIAGQQVDHDLLVEVAGMAEADALEAIRAAVASQLLVPVSLPDGRDGYAFRHALVQEAVTDDLLSGERRRLHRRSAEVLEGRAPGTGADAAAHWASLAHHWKAAGVDARAFEASLRAAESAEATFAFAAAVEHYERALELWSAVPDAEATAGFDRVALLAHAAQAAQLKGDAHRAVQLRREAIAAVGATEAPARLGVLHEQLGRAYWNSGDSGEAIAAYEEAVRLIPEEPPSPERAVVLAGLGQMLMLLDRWGDSRDVCEAAIRIARLVGARAAEGHALNTLGTDLAARGRCGEAIAALEAAQEIAFEVRNADDIARSFVNLCDALWICGDLARAAEVAERGIGVADDHGLRSSYGCVLRQSSVFVLYELGEWDVARRRAAEAFAGGASDTSTERDRLTRCGSLLVASGASEAGARLEQLAELLRSGPIESQFHAPFYTAIAELAIWEGRPADALAAVERGTETLAHKEMDWIVLRLHRVGARAAADLAEVARARRDSGLAAEALERLARLRHDRERIVKRSLVTHSGPAATATIAESATADAEELRANGIVNPGAWGSVVELWRATPRPYPTAYALWRLGEAELASGDRPAAAASLSEAAAIADRLDAKPLAAAVTGLVGRARLRLGPSRASDRPLAGAAAEPAAGPIDPFGLTTRELEVLGLLALGRTNRQIADELFISENTAGVHVSHILGKLGAGGRAEAAAIAARLGLGGLN
jgi:DNA-binding CsgD family transcriptional regulator/tetratricopeptide (TPR) repeat protein